MQAPDADASPAARVLVAMLRPLLRRGVMAWLGERYPHVEAHVVERAEGLVDAIATLRPSLLMTEPALLIAAEVPTHLLPRTLLLSAARHVPWDRPPEALTACAQVADALDERALGIAFERALACPRGCALGCASDACALRTSSRPPTLGLSGRELEVFSRLGHGEAPREIAAALGLSVKTVEHYRAQIKDKLALRDSRELLEFAVLWRRGLAARPAQLRST